MKEIKQNKAVNIGLLDETLKAALGVKCYGVSVRGDEVEVHLSDDATDNDLVLAAQIVTDHDSLQKTAKQTERETRQANLVADRAKFAQEDDLGQYGTSPLDLLAERVRWLEREIRELKGL